MPINVQLNTNTRERRVLCRAVTGSSAWGETLVLLFQAGEFKSQTPSQGRLLPLKKSLMGQCYLMRLISTLPS